jgi:hypothetical protein
VTMYHLTSFFHHRLFDKRQHVCHPPPTLLTSLGPLSLSCLPCWNEIERPLFRHTRLDRGGIAVGAEHPLRTQLPVACGR